MDLRKWNPCFICIFIEFLMNFAKTRLEMRMDARSFVLSCVKGILEMSMDARSFVLSRVKG